MKISITMAKKPKFKKPVMLCAWPGMGEVAFKLALYLKDKLKMEELAALEAPELFPATGVWVQDNIVTMPASGQGKFYFYKNRQGPADLILFISDAQPVLERAGGYAAKILSLAKDCKVGRVYTFAAMPQAIDHNAEPQVWFTVTEKKLAKELESLNIGLKPLASGQISGLNGLILGIAKESGFEGVCLLADIPLFTIQIENPKASLALLQRVAKILSITVAQGELEAQAKNMEQEIDKLIEFIQSPEQQSGPIGEDEIEKIKKTLSLYTKLPKSAREKIESLFKEAKINIAKANELKKELDHWNVYKEYEDRFLDLFKKPEKDSQNN